MPLQEYIAQPGVDKDPVAISYVMSRCSALYTVFGKNLERETAPERQQVRAEAYSVAERFLGAAALLMMRGTTIEMKDAFRRTSTVIVGLGNLYVDRIQAVRLRTNNMFDDTLIAGDFATCKALLAKLPAP